MYNKIAIEEEASINSDSNRVDCNTHKTHIQQQKEAVMEVYYGQWQTISFRGYTTHESVVLLAEITLLAT